MKKLKFEPNLVPKILSGKKTATWRVDDEKDIKIGDVLIFINSQSLEEFATAKATDVYEKTFGELKEPDRKGHERYDDDKQMYEIFSSYYKKSVGPDQRLKIIRYELI